MRLGFCPAGRRTAPDVVATVVAAEAAGLDEVWLAEDYFERGAFALAGAVASATERITIGLGVINAWTRHPALIAMEVAALQELAPGRVVLGLGTGNRHWMSDRLGLPFAAPLSHLLEAADVVSTLLADGTVARQGRFFDVDASLAFRAPGLDRPLTFGVKGPRALAAARERGADVVLPVGAGPEYVRWVREQVGPDRQISGYVIFLCDRDRRRARDRFRPTVAAYLGMHGDNAVTRCAGLDPDVARRFAEAWREGHPAAELVDDAMLDRFAVIGDDDDCRHGLAALAEAGLDAAILSDEAGVDAAEQIAALVRLGGSPFTSSADDRIGRRART